MWISEHYGIPLLDSWNYTDIPDGYIPNSSTYLSELNEAYGTSFKSVYPDSEGNITYFQKFCPDGVHPFSDPTGESDRILNDITSNLLDSILTNTAAKEVPSDTIQNGKSSRYYNMEGISVNAKERKGFLIERGDKGTRKVLR
ncbi:MAG: hypothetical protein IJP70_10360 [Bacteroidales bacterium]|nr:hypothetical protein [Bacteroidales bacterium]